MPGRIGNKATIQRAWPRRRYSQGQLSDPVVGGDRLFPVGTANAGDASQHAEQEMTGDPQSEQVAKEIELPAGVMPETARGRLDLDHRVSGESFFQDVVVCGERLATQGVNDAHKRFLNGRDASPEGALDEFLRRPLFSVANPSCKGSNFLAGWNHFRETYEASEVQRKAVDERGQGFRASTRCRWWTSRLYSPSISIRREARLSLRQNRAIYGQ